MELEVKRVREDAILPYRGSKYSAGLDLYACLPTRMPIYPNETVMIPTGIACNFPKGYFGMMVVRSSVGAKRHLVLANQVGILDEDYKGEIMMAIRNEGDSTQVIDHGERLAQMILLPYAMFNLMEVDELSESERGEGGFGSTGK